MNKYTKQQEEYKATLWHNYIHQGKITAVDSNHVCHVISYIYYNIIICIIHNYEKKNKLENIILSKSKPGTSPG